ncbi:MAG: YicC family protein [Clostridia bacterium]|nr:YicC family protein [Clostridia bacterium]
MIKSMTGYGRAQKIVDGIDITVEVKSVNHRYFEFSSRVPRAYGFLEDKLKSLFQKSISRGKVDCYVQIDCLDTPDALVEVNFSLADGYIKALDEISSRYGNVKNDITASIVSRYPDVLSVRKKPEDEEKIWAAVETVASMALDAFVNMRKVEGSRMYDDIMSRCDTILGYVEFVEKKSPETVGLYVDKLKARMRDLIGDVNVDEQRLLTEAAIFADKIAVAEETVRLKSHIEQMRTFLNAEEAIGRKMDFLVQEFNREANTIGSKSQEIELSRTVVEIKSEIEKIREQVQNIE